MRLQTLTQEQTEAAIEAAELLADRAHELGGDLLEEALFTVLARRMIMRKQTMIGGDRKIYSLCAAIREATAAARVH